MGICLFGECRWLSPWLLLLVVAVLLLSTLAESTDTTTGTTSRSNNKKEDDSVSSSSSSSSSSNGCRLYLGPSHLSTEDRLVLGVYAGQDFSTNDVIPGSDLAIPLIDFTDGVDRVSYRHLDNLMNLIESQVWLGDYGGSVKWEGNYSTMLAIPGVPMISNYHSGTSNIDWQQHAAMFREKRPTMEATMWPTGEKHITRGAISPYYNFTMVATQDIPMGMELFANFGDTWDRVNANSNNNNNNKNKDDDDIYQDKLTRGDYRQADEIVDHILQFMDTYQDQIATIAASSSKNQEQEDYDFEEALMDFILDQILQNAAEKKGKVIKSLLPDTVKKIKQVKHMGGTFQYRNQDIQKSKKWLNRNAVCMDNLRVGPSTIPQAGRGAFATRKIQKDSIIVPTPMLHITDRDAFNMFKINEVYDDNDPDDDTYELEHDYTLPMGKQLLLNYCFGHPESSLLLLPTGPMVYYINHAPTHSSNPASPKANAVLTWSSQFNEHQLHDLTIQQLNRRDAVSLVMNVKATRDIQPGEEIFIDYGPQWTREWNAYQTHYQRAIVPNPQNWPIRAQDMRIQYSRSQMPYGTNLRKSRMPYPPNVATACFLETEEVPDGHPRMNAKGQEIFSFTNPTSLEEYNGLKLYICDVMSRTEKLTDGNLYNYTVVAKLSDGTVEQVVNVPHRAITFVDRPYSSDIHQPWAFRHWIGIRDADFPQAWRNLR